MMQAGEMTIAAALPWKKLDGPEKDGPKLFRKRRQKLLRSAEQRVLLVKVFASFSKSATN